MTEFLNSFSLAAPDPHAAERKLALVLIQLVVIVATARLAGMLFKKMGQPSVIGEILAGLMLGPSLLQKIEIGIWGNTPISAVLFSEEVRPVFGMLKELGLVFLLFLIGLEFDFSHVKSRGKASAMISIAGVAVPFALGFGLGHLIFGVVGNERAVVEGVPIIRAGNVHSFSLFMGTAMSITAMPVLGRILMEWNVTRTRIGAVTITAAAMDDATGWILLAAVSAVAKTGFDPAETFTMIGLLIGFVSVMFFAVRPAMGWWIRKWHVGRDGTIGVGALALVIAAIFICALVTSKIGIFAIFGAFTLGAMLSGNREFGEALTNRLRDFVVVFFIPIYFTYTGLITDVGSLANAELWGIAALVVGAAILGKLGGCTIAAKLGGFTWRESGVIGTLMNTRGLMELIVINVGWNLGVIPSSIFCMLVIMAVVTTVMTTPLTVAIMRGTEFEPFLVANGFAKRRERKAAVRESTEV
jgi:Kef-type K+ transport system membrane component KefB